MKIKGFTMAEMMIVIAIIGTVAAMTIPTLRLNIEQNKTVAAVKKAYNTLENANAMLLATNDARSIRTICGDELYLKCLVDKGILKASPIEIDSTYVVKAFGGKSYKVPHNQRDHQYLGKEGFLYQTYYEQDPLYGNKHWRNAGHFEGLREARFGDKFTSVLVDINGLQKPNTFAKDIFLFHIDERGEAIPSGSAVHAQWMGNVDYETEPYWKEKCSATQVTVWGQDCAGSIIDNNKMIYLNAKIK